MIESTLIDKENESFNSPAMGKLKTAKASLTGGKRNFNSITTPLAKKSLGSSALRDITNSTYSSKAVDSLKVPAITVSKPESRLRDRVSSQPKDITELLALPDDLLPDIESVPQTLESDELAGLPPIEDLEQVSGQLFVHDLSEEEPEDSVALDEALKRFIVDPGDFEWVFSTSQPDEADLRPCYMFDDVPNRIECK